MTSESGRSAKLSSAVCHVQSGKIKMLFLKKNLLEAPCAQDCFHCLAVCQGRPGSQDHFSFLAGPSLLSAHEFSVKAGPLPSDSIEIC